MNTEQSNSELSRKREKKASEDGLQFKTPEVDENYKFRMKKHVRKKPVMK